MAEPVKQVRWVQYRIETQSTVELFFGLFEVTFYEGSPTHADPVRLTGYSRADDEYMKFRRAVTYAGELPTLNCTNPVQKSRWNGSLIFDYLPILT